MPILNLNHVSLYYEEFGRGDRYLIQAQQFVNSHIYYTKDLADRCGFHAFIIRIRGYAPSSMVTEDLGDDWYDVWAQDCLLYTSAWSCAASTSPALAASACWSPQTGTRSPSGFIILGAAWPICFPPWRRP